LDTRVDTAEADITALEAADVALDGRLDTAEADITALEAADVALDGRLDTAEADITALEAADVALDGRLDTAETNIAANTTAINSLDTRVDTAETNIAANTTAISNLDTRVDTAETDIADLQTNDAAQDVQIAAISGANADALYVDINSDGTAADATGVDAVAIGERSVASFDNSVALGAGSVTTAANQVNVGGRTVSGLAAGELSATSTDAVTGAQLFATNQAVSAMDTRVDTLELLAVDFDRDLRKLDRKMEGSTAIAIAMSGNAFLPDKAFNLTGNVGTYEGAFAGALQIGAVVSPNAAFNAGVATNFNKKGGVGARAGFTFGW